MRAAVAHNRGHAVLPPVTHRVAHGCRLPHGRSDFKGQSASIGVSRGRALRRHMLVDPQGVVDVPGADQGVVAPEAQHEAENEGRRQRGGQPSLHHAFLRLPKQNQAGTTAEGREEEQRLRAVEGEEAEDHQGHEKDDQAQEGEKEGTGLAAQTFLPDSAALGPCRAIPGVPRRFLRQGAAYSNACPRTRSRHTWDCQAGTPVKGCSQHCGDAWMSSYRAGCG
eukprot:CAMPEP_0170596764 /NCGR_PEP_ID=MMETSP0224-20130122/15316_1 /TAXON_ID=285029 /ORGANISM="Togula jolla, Strain CCCM 725" /LENGTH=222 /DNA_ID=CAMNT_0010921127 /DNA_START=402 /DNA_END=1067 /DNA_ORIENTATION=+